MSILSKLKRRFKETPSQATMRYCYENGFTSGKNFQSYSEYPIDTNWPWLISVGDDVTFSTNVKILAHDASTSMTSKKQTKVGIVRIGNNVFIGANSTVLCNVRIGNNVIIGAGSVVTKDIPSNQVWGGAPAKYICTFDEFEKKHSNNQLRHPICDEYKWNQWKDAPLEEKMKMAKKLEETYGYVG